MKLLQLFQETRPAGILLWQIHLRQIKWRSMILIQEGSSDSFLFWTKSEDSSYENKKNQRIIRRRLFPLAMAIPTSWHPAHSFTSPSPLNLITLLLSTQYCVWPSPTFLSLYRLLYNSLYIYFFLSILSLSFSLWPSQLGQQNTLTATLQRG